jgi:hypothetical protein
VLYLAGRLSEDEAEAFETHYFGCADCWEDVHRGSELRAAFGKPAVAPASRSVRPRRAWLPLAAAAVIAFVALGVWQLTRRTPVESTTPVVRGAGEVLDLEVASGRQGGIDVRWPPHPNAATYEIEVLASNGASVWKTETPEPRVRIGPGVLAAPRQTHEVRVEALDSLGQVIASGQASLAPKP